MYSLAYSIKFYAFHPILLKHKKHHKDDFDSTTSRDVPEIKVFHKICKKRELYVAHCNHI
jgi:hypothetical protein